MDFVEPPAEDGVFDFPAFEAFEPDDRPPAPDQEDYPNGCEAELVDINKARLAQTNEYWEPFMEQLFTGRKRVVVIRHSGEYTLVEWRENPECIIGCSLYRACLKEPKVKFKRYAPFNVEESESMQPASSAPMMAPVLAAADVDQDEDDPLAAAIAPPEKLPPMVPTAAPTTATAPPVTTSSPPAQQLPPQPPSTPPRPTPPTPSATHQSKKMRDRGNKAFQEQRFDEAVTFYTQALELDPTSEAIRIYSNRSAAFLALHQTERAMEDARMCVKIDPKQIMGYVREANVMRSMKRYDVARKIYTKALALDPRNAEIAYAMKCNSAAEFFRVRTESLPISVSLKQSTGRLEVTSKRSHGSNDVVFVEPPQVAVPIFGEHVDQGRFCAECMRSLIRKETVVQQFTTHETQHLVQTLFNETPHIIPCSEGCGQMYCSEVCRNKAWSNHHWMECPIGGKWATGVTSCRQLVSANRQLFPADILARVMLVVRMICWICSCGKTLRDAVSSFVWLPSKEYPPNQAQIEEVLLRPAYAYLQSHFGREENALLDWALFLRTFQQTGSAVDIRCTPWPAFASKVESHLALLTHMRNDASTMRESLIQMINAGAVIPNLSAPCLTVLSVFALTVTGSTETAVTNVELRREAESALGVQVVANKAIKRGDKLKAMPLVALPESSGAAA